MIRSIPILCLSASEKTIRLTSHLAGGRAGIAIAFKGEAPPIGIPSKLLSGLIGQHIWFRNGMLLRGFVVALLAICIIGSRGLIAGLTRMIVVLCSCTSALLHISDPLQF